jgi:hypothetical protein
MRDKRLLTIWEQGSIALRYDAEGGRIVMGGRKKNFELMVKLLEEVFGITENNPKFLNGKVQFHPKKRMTPNDFFKALKEMEAMGIPNQKVDSLERVMR